MILSGGITSVFPCSLGGAVVKREPTQDTLGVIEGIHFTSTSRSPHHANDCFFVRGSLCARG